MTNQNKLQTIRAEINTCAIGGRARKPPMEAENKTVDIESRDKTG
jgi:hypothetical protein